MAEKKKDNREMSQQFIIIIIIEKTTLIIRQTDPPECEHVAGCVLFVTKHAVCLLRVQTFGSAFRSIPG